MTKAERKAARDAARAYERMVRTAPADSELFKPRKYVAETLRAYELSGRFGVKRADVDPAPRKRRETKADKHARAMCGAVRETWQQDKAAERRARALGYID